MSVLAEKIYGYASIQGWGVCVLVGVPKIDDAFKTHPLNLLSERTLKGAFYGNYKPVSDIPNFVNKYMNKVMSFGICLDNSLPTIHHSVF